MAEKLTGNDMAFILESLKYTRMKFQEYPYDSEEFRKERPDRVDDVVTKVKALAKDLPEPSD